MAVFILSNRKILLKGGKIEQDSFSNDEVSLPNFRIAKCNFENWKVPTKTEVKSKNYKGRAILDYKILSEPGNVGYRDVVEVIKKKKNW